MDQLELAGSGQLGRASLIRQLSIGNSSWRQLSGVGGLYLKDRTTEWVSEQYLRALGHLSKG